MKFLLWSKKKAKSSMTIDAPCFSRAKSLIGVLVILGLGTSTTWITEYNYSDTTAGFPPRVMYYSSFHVRFYINKPIKKVFI